MDSNTQFLQSDEFYREILANISDGVFLTDDQDRFVWVCPNINVAFGWTQEEVLAMGHLRALVGENTLPSQGNRAIGEEHNLQWSITHKSGQRRVLSVKVKCVHVNTGRWLFACRDITERMRAEEALQESEERYRSLFCSSLDAVLLTAPDGQILAANEAACRMFGRSEEELRRVGRNGVVDLLDVRLAPALEERARTGKFRGELTFVRKDGTKFPGGISSAVFLDRNGQQRTSMVIRDITERKQTELALRESEERYRAVVEDQTETICRVQADGTFTFVNEVYCRFYGKTSQELLGQKWHPNAFSEDIPQIEAKLRALSPANSVVIIENRVVSATRQIHWMQFVNRAFFDPQGHLVEIQSVGRNITALKNAMEALRESENRLKLALAASRMGVWEWDVRTNAVFWSSESLAITGLDRSDVTLESFTNLIHPDDAAGVMVSANKALATKAIFKAEFRIIRPDGEIRWLADLGQGEYDEAGQPLRMVGTAQDITEKRKLEEELLESRQLIRTLAAHSVETEENERKRLARELHDQVGQNLTAIGLNLNLLHDQLPRREPPGNWKPLTDAIRLLEQTTEQVRTVMAELRPPVLDDYGLLAALRWYAGQFAGRTGLQVLVSANQESIRLDSAVEHALFRIAQEALTNVAKHARARSVDIWLEISSQVVLLEVDDDGQGFDVLARPLTAGRQGWGMLTMSERAAGVGGHCRVESSPERGTSIIVEVPA